MIGQTISHYRITEKLGGGGMGVVYKAEDTKLKRTVALKFLPAEVTHEDDTKVRFIHEAQAASALQHNNICGIHEIGESPDGQLFIVMDLYEGDTLKSRIAKGQFRIEDSVDLATQIAQGLQKAHDKGIVHRDIKPANILITTDGVAKIVDFGLAKLSGRTLLTKSGTTMGTAAYMSPEQARGEQVDSRSDIWSLGVVFYEMLTGKRPFESDYEQAMVYSILNEEPKPVTSFRADITEPIAQVVRKAMAKNPDERYQSMADLIADMKSSQTGEPLASPRSRRVTVKRAVIALVELAVVTAAIVAIVLLTGGKPDIRSVAVMPFVNSSGDSAMAGVSDMMTEDVIANIGQLSHMTKVISFNGVMKFKDKEVTPVQAGEELGVDAVAVCRIYRRGNEYNFRLEIVSVRDNTPMKNEQFISQLADMTVLPKRMAATIMRSFGSSVTDAEVDTKSRRQTDNLDAYRLYQKGYAHYNLWWSPADLRLSLEYYRKALVLDPQYSLAHGGLALSYMQLAATGVVPLTQIKDSSTTEAQKALAIDEKLPEAHLALTMLKYSNYESGASIEEGFKRTIQLNPSYADAIHCYAHWLSETRKPDRAIEMMLRSVEYEPLNPHFQHCVGIAYGQARRWDECQAAFNKLFEMDSAYWRGVPEEFLSRSAKARRDSAVVIGYYRKWMIQYPQDSLGHLVLMNAYLGRISFARECMRKMDFVGRPTSDQRFWMVKASTAVKDKKEALRWLEAMYQHRDGMFQWVNTDPAYDFLIGDPRFEALMKKAGYRD